MGMSPGQTPAASSPPKVRSAIVHEPVTPREGRGQAKPTQAQMAPLMGMSLSGYRKWKQGTGKPIGPAAILLRLIQKKPEVVRRALTVGERGNGSMAGKHPHGPITL